jgi:DNA-binding SARP family transcriptional activator/TolB-like protein
VDDSGGSSERPGGDVVALRLLGSPEVKARDVVRIASRNGLALLAYLAMRPDHSATREHLAHLIWADRSDAQARHNLRQCLVALRKELGEAAAHILVVDRDRVALDPAHITVDALKFLALSASDDPDRLQEAAALFSGSFCEGFDLAADAFSEWRRSERARIDATAARVIRALAEHFDRITAGDRAIGCAERLVALDPLDESAHRLLMRLKARYSGRSSALAAAERCIAIIRENLDAPVSDETLRLIDDIRQGAIAPVQVAASHNREPGIPVASVPEPAVPDREAQRPPAWRSRILIAAAASACGLVVIALAFAPALRRGSSARLDSAWTSPGPARVPVADLRREGISPIVVLPFATEGEGDTALARTASRITDDLTNDLARVPALRVISVATARTYAGRAHDVGTIANELEVAYAVEGSVRSESGQLRINIALIDGQSRLQLWSSRFVRGQSDLPAMQDEIARALARQLHVGVLEAAAQRRADMRTAEVAQGWAAMLRISEDGASSKAGDHFAAALARDPDNESALTGLGAFHVSLVAMFLVDEPESHLALAQDNLARALKRNPEASVAHYFSGILHKTRGEPEEALESFERVLALNPSFAPAYAQIGQILSRLGRLDESIENVRYAIRLSPKDPNLGLWSLFAGEIELERGHDQVAIEYLTRAAALDPRSPFIHAALAAAFATVGDRASALTHADEVRRLAPWLTPARMTERLIGLSRPGSKPVRLLQGLAQMFPG